MKRKVVKMKNVTKGTIVSQIQSTNYVNITIFTEENFWPALRNSETLRREKSPNAATRRFHTQLPNSKSTQAGNMMFQSKRADSKFVVPQQMRRRSHETHATRVVRLQTAPSSTLQHPNAKFNGQARFSRR